MASDPHWNKVVLALHCDGANGSTTFTDVTGKTVTASGNAQISTAQSKFGGGSAYFDGTGDYISCTHADFAFGTGDFTVELWVYPTSASADYMLIDFRVTNGLFPCLYMEAAGNIVYYVNSSVAISAAHGMTAATWNHIALVRSGGVTRVYVGGVQKGASYADTNNYSVGANRPVVGTNGASIGASSLNGYIDDLRITKGVARYTANFTPPAVPFPNQLPVVSGVVQDSSGNFAQRLVRVLDRKTCSVLNAGLSDATTGAYTLPVATADEVIVMAHDTADADPYWANVVLAMHMNGANNSTYFRDEKGKVVTANGNAKISTAQSKWGVGSAYFDGTGDYLALPAGSDFDFGTTGDFTVEAFVYIAANSSLDASNRRFAHILSIDNGTAESCSFYVTGDASTTGTGLGLWNGTHSASATVTISQSAWHHVELTRYSGNLRFFLDGTQVGSTTAFAYQLGNSAHPPKVGGRPWSTNYYYYLNGYIQDLKIYKGYAKHTANFTAPTAAFPDSLNGGTENALIYDRVIPA